MVLAAGGAIVLAAWDHLSAKKERFSYTLRNQHYRKMGKSTNGDSPFIDYFPFLHLVEIPNLLCPPQPNGALVSMQIRTNASLEARST